MSASRQNCRQHPVSISFNAAPSNSTDQVHPFVRFPDIILMMPPASSSASSSAATSPEDGCAPRFRDGKIFPLDFPVYDASASGGIIPLDVQDRIQDELRQIFGCASRMRATLICRTRFFSRAMRQSRRTMIFAASSMFTTSSLGIFLPLTSPAAASPACCVCHCYQA